MRKDRHERVEDIEEAIINVIKRLAIACDCYEQVRSLPQCTNCAKKYSCERAKFSERWEHVNCPDHQKMLRF